MNNPGGQRRRNSVYKYACHFRLHFTSKTGDEGEKENKETYLEAETDQ